MIPIPGSQHLEFVIAGSLRWPELSGPPHGDPRRWDWGVTVRSLAEAQIRSGDLQRVEMWREAQVRKRWGVG